MAGPTLANGACNTTHIMPPSRIWAIARHIQRLLEVLEALEASSTFSESFLHGDAAVIVTRTGFTFSKFTDHPEMLYPAQIDDAAATSLRCASARHAARIVFRYGSHRF